MSFGKKGLGAGGAAARGAGGFGSARPAQRMAQPMAASPQAQPASSGSAAFAEPGSEIAAKREAFIAAERARREQEAGSVGEASWGEPSQGGFGHSNRAMPAQPARPAMAGAGTTTPYQSESSAAERSGWNPSTDAMVARARNRASGRTLGPNQKPYFKMWGHPEDRQILTAYVMWWFGAALSIHRVYCGHAESALYQFALVVCSLIVGAIYPPMAAFGIVIWLLWLIADLFLMPGMMRRFRARYANADIEEFA